MYHMPSLPAIDPASFDHLKMSNTGYHRPWDHVPHDQNLLEQTHTTANMTKFGNGKIQIHIDVHHFGPNDIAVKTLGNTIIIECRHTERLDDFGIVERHFVRKFPLPEANKESDVQSTLSSDGVLTVTVLAPDKMEDTNEDYQTVPVHRTGPLHLTLHNFRRESSEKPMWKY